MDDYKGFDFTKVDRQNEITGKYANLENEDMENIEKNIYITCQEIRQYYNEKNDKKITNSLLDLPSLIKNENLTYIPGLEDFDIPDILFEIITFDNPNIRKASIICLTGISRFDESESLFDSEAFCQNFLSTFLNEKDDDILSKMLMLLDNIFGFNNQRINSFFIENKILKKIISIIEETWNLDIAKIAFNLISIHCKSKLEKSDIYLIYHIISRFQSEHKLLNYYFMKIFYNLLNFDSFLCDEFIQHQFYSFVKIAIQKNLSITARYGCKIIKNLVEKYNCYQCFDPYMILELLFIEPKKDDIENEVQCLISAITCLNSFIGKEPEITNFLLTENSFKNLLYLARTRNVSFAANLLYIFVSLYDIMPNDSFDLTFTVYEDQNIFHYLSNIVEANDLVTVKQVLKLICLIFQKSVPLNKAQACIDCFKDAFSPEIFNTLEDFQDETINQYIPQICSFLSIDANNE